MSNEAYPANVLRGAVDLSSLNRPVAPPPGEPGGAPLAGGYVVDVTEADFAQVVQGSTQYPVIMLLWLPTDKANADLATLLGNLAAQYGGRFLLARVDVYANPQIAAAFQVEGVPTVAAVLAGQPVPLFAGTADETQIRAVLDQILAAAEQNGIAGRAPLDGELPDDADLAAAAAAEPEEPPLPPLHEEAFEAIEREDYAAAIAAYELALKQDPSDSMAVAGLAQVKLLQRTANVDPSAVLAAAAASPTDLAAQLAAADQEAMEGSSAAALNRLTALLPDADADTKEQLRVRLIEYFEIIGATDPAVLKARQKLALYLY